MCMVNKEEINNLLSRGVENIFPNREFLEAKLNKKEKLTIYLGIDPTGKNLHLGHIIPLRKLSEFQKLGHQIILLIGDFTARIGDPTDKTATRKKLTTEQVAENLKEYKKQVSKFISFSGENKALLKFNSKWLAKRTFEEIIELTSLITVDQMLKRDMFVRRMEENKPIYIHEFLYPVMQGYDSVAMDVDGEVGGNDQTFNMLVGRDFMKKIKNKEKFVIATKLLTDPEGKKMGKTEDNMVSLDQGPDDIFGKIMSWNDNLIMPGFELCTDINTEEVLRINNPKEQKILLAKEIVSMIHNKAKANKAQKNFENTFKKGAVPDNIIEISLSSGEELKNHIVNSKIVSSNTDWKRLIEENAVSIVGTEEIIKDPYIKADKDVVLRIGKKRFVKIIVK